ncbi:hypothetical protein RXV86_15135 [Alisedimentitalea sp. MJ-SS2]|nr:hypothetical protein [Alisedimentitalea sp. MJ-SS2]
MEVMEQEWIFNFVGLIVAACIVGGAVYSGLKQIAEALRSNRGNE